MIQRIQSVYLLISTVLPLFCLRGSILRFVSKAGNEVILNFNGIYQKSVNGEFSLSGSLLPVSITIILIPLISFTAIFLFKRRKFQHKVALAAVVLEIIMILLLVYYGFIATDGFQAVLLPGLKIFIPPVTLVAGILAYRGIRKDEKLVSSFDRLR